MPFLLDVKPRFEDDIPYSPEKNKSDSSSQEKVTFNVLFAGLPVTEETAVHAVVAVPQITLVSDLTRSLAEFCAQKHGGGGNAEVAEIKLNCNGVSLLDPNENIQHLLSRAVRHPTKAGVLPKIFVAGKFLSPGDAAASQNAAAAAGSNSSAMRRDRHGQQGDGSLMGGNLPPEQADAVANMFASNPDFIMAIMRQDPQMQEMLRNNPEMEQQLRDPDTIREMLRSQLGDRNDRAMSDQAMRSALGQVFAHPDGHDLVERALGRHGVLNDGSAVGGESIYDATANNTATSQEGSLLPLGHAPAMQQQQMNNLFGMGGGGGGFPMMVPPLQQQQQQSGAPTDAEKKQKIDSQIADCVSQLKEMGFDEEMALLAAQDETVQGELEKALALLESWQT